MRIFCNRLLLVSLLLVLGVAPSTVNAGVIVTGDVTLIAAPSSDIQGSDPTSNSTAYIWLERSGLVLPSAVAVNMTHPGTAGPSNYNPSHGTIAKGTVVNSYLIHSDPVGSTAQNYTGSVTFGTPILGIIDTIDGLADTDALLGSPTTTYPGNSTDRGLESPDSLVWVSNNGLTLNFTTSSFVDEVRVVVASTPEPSSLISAATAAALLLGFGFIRRRSVDSSIALI